MGRFRGAMLAKEMMARTAIEQKNADAITRKGKSAKTVRKTANEALGAAKEVSREIVRDDGVAPRAAQGVVVAPFYHQVDVTWSDPFEGDHVQYAVVEAKPRVPAGSSARTFRGALHFATLFDLDPVPTDFRVRFVDRWGRLGDWSAVLTATPERTAAEYIDAAEVEIAGKFGWENLDPLTDAANLGDDVVTARAMAVQDAAALNLWVANASIQSAKIANLSVDKLMAGTFTAGQITLAGLGKLAAGRTTISSDGLTLPTLPEFVAPASDLDAKITNISGTASMHFYSQAVSGASDHRGVVISARGDGSTYRGNVMIEARSSPNAGRSAYVGVGSASAGTSGASNTVYVGPQLLVEGDLEVRGRWLPSFIGNWFSIGAGRSAVWTHGLRTIPNMIFGQQALGGGEYKPLPVGGTEFGVYVESVTSTSVTIINKEDRAWSCRPILYE